MSEQSHQAERTSADLRCAYCGAPATTRDHIPPKKLFPQPWTDDLITVPACGTCNNCSSSDDEHFIWMMTISVKAVGEHADNARKQRFSTPTTPRRQRMAANVLQGLTRAAITTPAGLYLGHATLVDADLERVNRVLERIVRGLYFKELGVAVPANRSVRAFPESPTQPFEMEAMQPVIGYNPRSVANGAFEYWYRPMDDDPQSVVILMRFFAGILAVGFVKTTDVLRCEEAKQSAAADSPRE
jgi:hypothetical protein